MITAIIVDDEPNGAKTLNILLHKYCPQVKVHGLYESVASARAALESRQPDLVFLDIEMPVENGFSLLEQTKGYKYHVIFTTAYNHYALSAIKANAIDYLLKPVDIEELMAAVAKVEERASGSHELDVKKMESLFGDIMAQKMKKIPLPSQDGISFVDPAEIVCLEADSNYTHVYLASGKKLTISKTMKVFEKNLEGLPFLRVHYSYIVNLAHIEKYIKGDGGSVIVKGNRSIPVSRTGKNELLVRMGLEDA